MAEPRCGSAAIPAGKESWMPGAGRKGPTHRTRAVSGKTAWRHPITTWRVGEGIRVLLVRAHSFTILPRRVGGDRKRTHPPGCRRHGGTRVLDELALMEAQQDRKSTRLNSSHVRISYAVFCLK